MCSSPRRRRAFLPLDGVRLEMTANPDEPPLPPDSKAEPPTEHGSPMDHRWGRVIAATIAVGIILWDVLLIRQNSSAVGIFIVDACAACFMWTGSSWARWICGLRCLLPGLVAAPVAVLEGQIGIALAALAVVLAAYFLLFARRVRAFFAFQKARRRDVLGDD